MPRRRKRRSWQGSLRLGALLSVLLAINVYVFFFRGGTSLRDILKAQSVGGEAPDAPNGAQSVGGLIAPPGQNTPDRPSVQVDDADHRHIDGIVVAGDSLVSLVRRQGLAAAQAEAVAKALTAAAWDPRSFRAGQAYRIGLDGEGQFRSLELR